MEFDVPASAEQCIKRLESYHSQAFFIHSGLEVESTWKQDGSYDFLISRTWRPKHGRNMVVQAPGQIRPLSRLSARVTCQIEFTRRGVGMLALLVTAAIISFAFRQPQFGVIWVGALIYMGVLIWAEYVKLGDIIASLKT